MINNQKNQKVLLEHVKLEDTWKAMEKLVEEGLVKSIGVSNFSISTILDIMTYAKIKPAINQVEVHPLCSQNAMLEECKEFGILVEGSFKTSSFFFSFEK